jgi:hypothetical protein
MSEFQVYKFRSVDRLLTNQERTEISSWSSRTTATANSATFTYSYGSFPEDEEKVLYDYFDIFLYFSSWGTKRLMLKFPIDLVSFKEIEQYAIITNDETSHLDATKTDRHVILDFQWSEEGAEFWLEEKDYEASDFIIIREAILNGDYSVLYLFWLKLADIEENDTEYEDDEDDHPDSKMPPVPPQLKSIGASIHPFVDFFEIDKDLVAAAKTLSLELLQEESKKNYKALLQQLSEAEKEDYLWQLLQGVSRIDIKLKQHLDRLAPTTTNNTSSISLLQIMEIKEKEEIERRSIEKEKAAQAHRQKMEKIAKEKKEQWESVYFNLNRKTGSSYDLATSILKDLKALAEYEGKKAEFENQMQQIKKDYGRSVALMERFKKAGL